MRIAYSSVKHTPTQTHTHVTETDALHIKFKCAYAYKHIHIRIFMCTYTDTRVCAYARVYMHTEYAYICMLDRLIDLVFDDVHGGDTLGVP